MRGTIAIVYNKWSKFLVEGGLHKDLMSLEIIKFIDIRLDNYWI
jgi:hypothetical protein